MINPFSTIDLDFAGSRRSKTAAKILPVFVSSGENDLAKIVDFEEIESLSPIVFVGSSGSGKSVLAEQAVNNFVSENELTCRKTNGADFARTYSMAVDSDSVEQWRKKFTQSKILLFEQLHLLAGKPAAQLELERILDHLDSRFRLVVFTSLVPYFDIDEFSNRLASRLSSGLMIRLELPNLQSRLEIVCRLFKQNNITASEQAIKTIAEKVISSTSNLSRLVSSLIKSAENDSIDEEFVRNFLLRNQASKVVPVKEVVSLISKRLNVSLADIRGSTRKQAVVHARSVGMFLARQLCDLSLERIGKSFGNRDHSTVLYACNKIENEIKKDKNTQKLIDELTGLLTTD